MTKTTHSQRIRTATIVLCWLAVLWTGQGLAEEPAVVGAKIADFQAAVTSVTYKKDRTLVNLESAGDIGKYGTVQATATFMHPRVQKPAVGAYNHRGASYRPDGSVVPFTARGTWTSLGDHRWQVNAIGLADDGTRTLSKGILELKSRTLKGSVYSLD